MPTGNSCTDDGKITFPMFLELVRTSMQEANLLTKKMVESFDVFVQQQNLPDEPPISNGNTMLDAFQKWTQCTDEQVNSLIDLTKNNIIL